MNSLVVVDHEDPAYLHFRRFHRHTPALHACTGSSSTNVAPFPGPALRALSEPPICRAALADACNPNPCPSFFVVNPWLNIRVRFSGSMPTPLSLTSIITLGPSALGSSWT